MNRRYQLGIISDVPKSLTPYVSKKVNMGVLWNDKIELYHDGQVPRYVQTSYIKLVGLWA